MQNKTDEDCSSPVSFVFLRGFRVPNSFVAFALFRGSRVPNTFVLALGVLLRFARFFEPRFLAFFDTWIARQQSGFAQR